MDEKIILSSNSTLKFLDKEKINDVDLYKYVLQITNNSDVGEYILYTETNLHEKVFYDKTQMENYLLNFVSQNQGRKELYVGNLSTTDNNELTVSYNNSLLEQFDVSRLDMQGDDNKKGGGGGLSEIQQMLNRFDVSSTENLEILSDSIRALSSLVGCGGSGEIEGKIKTLKDFSVKKGLSTTKGVLSRVSTVLGKFSGLFGGSISDDMREKVDALKDMETELSKAITKELAAQKEAAALAEQVDGIPFFRVDGGNLSNEDYVSEYKQLNDSIQSKENVTLKEMFAGVREIEIKDFKLSSDTANKTYQAIISNMQNGDSATMDQALNILMSAGVVDAEGIEQLLAQYETGKTVQDIVGLNYEQYTDLQTQMDIVMEIYNSQKGKEFLYDTLTSFYTTSEGQVYLRDSFKAVVNSENDIVKSGYLDDRLINTAYIEYCMQNGHEEWIMDEFNKTIYALKVVQNDEFACKNDGGNYKYTSLGERLLYEIDMMSDDPQYQTAFSNAVKMIATLNDDKLKYMATHDSFDGVSAEEQWMIIEGEIPDKNGVLEKLTANGELSFQTRVNNQIAFEELCKYAGINAEDYGDNADALKNAIAERFGISVSDLADEEKMRTALSDTKFNDLPEWKQMAIVAAAQTLRTVGTINGVGNEAVVLGAKVTEGIGKWGENVYDTIKTLGSSDAWLFLQEVMGQEFSYSFSDTSEMKDMIKEYEKRYNEELSKYRAELESRKSEIIETEEYKKYCNQLSIDINSLSEEYIDVTDMAWDSYAQHSFKYDGITVNDHSTSSLYISTLRDAMYGDDTNYKKILANETAMDRARKQFETMEEVSIDHVSTWFEKTIYDSNLFTKIEDLSLVKRDSFLAEAALQIGTMAVPVGLSIVGGALGFPAVATKTLSSLALGVSAFGGSVEEAFNSGAGYNQAITYGTTSAITEMAVEQLFTGIGGLGQGVLDTKTFGLINKFLTPKNIHVRYILEYAKKGFGEGVEEVFTDLITPISQYLIYQKDLTDMSMGEYWDEQVSLEGLTHTFFISALTGMVFGSMDINAQKNTLNTNATVLRDLTQGLLVDKPNLQSYFKKFFDIVRADTLAEEVSSDAYKTLSILDNTIQKIENQISEDIKKNGEVKAELEQLAAELRNLANEINSQTVELNIGEDSVSIPQNALINAANSMQYKRGKTFTEHLVEVDGKLTIAEGMQESFVNSLYGYVVSSQKNLTEISYKVTDAEMKAKLNEAIEACKIASSGDFSKLNSLFEINMNELIEEYGEKTSGKFTVAKDITVTDFQAVVVGQTLLNRYKVNLKQGIKTITTYVYTDNIVFNESMFSSDTFAEKLRSELESNNGSNSLYLGEVVVNDAGVSFNTNPIMGAIVDKYHEANYGLKATINKVVNTTKNLGTSVVNGITQIFATTVTENGAVTAEIQAELDAIVESGDVTLIQEFIEKNSEKLTEEQKSELQKQAEELIKTVKYQGVLNAETVESLDIEYEKAKTQIEQKYKEDLSKLEETQAHEREEYTSKYKEALSNLEKERNKSDRTLTREYEKKISELTKQKELELSKATEETQSEIENKYEQQIEGLKQELKSKKDALQSEYQAKRQELVDAKKEFHTSQENAKQELKANKQSDISTLDEYYKTQQQQIITNTAIATTTVTGTSTATKATTGAVTAGVVGTTVSTATSTNTEISKKNNLSENIAPEVAVTPISDVRRMMTSFVDNIKKEFKTKVNESFESAKTQEAFESKIDEIKQELLIKFNDKLAEYEKIIRHTHEVEMAKLTDEASRKTLQEQQVNELDKFISDARESYNKAIDSVSIPVKEIVVQEINEVSKLQIDVETAEVLKVSELGAETKGLLDRSTININESYIGYEYVVKPKNDLESVIEQINNSNVEGNILLEIPNTSELTLELIDRIPSNVEVRIVGAYNMEFYNGFKAKQASTNAALSHVTYTTQELTQIMHEMTEFENGIDSSWTDMEKAQYAYEYLGNKIKYDPNPKGGNVGRAKQFDGLLSLVVNESTCQGFSHTYQELLNRMGIESVIINGKFKGSKGMGHVYNVVTINGESFIVDTVRKFQNAPHNIGSGFNVENLSQYQASSNVDSIEKIQEKAIENLKNNPDLQKEALEKGYYRGFDVVEFIDAGIISGDLITDIIPSERDSSISIKEKALEFKTMIENAFNTTIKAEQKFMNSLKDSIKIKANDSIITIKQKIDAFNEITKGVRENSTLESAKEYFKGKYESALKVKADSKVTDLYKKLSTITETQFRSLTTSLNMKNNPVIIRNRINNLAKTLNRTTVNEIMQKYISEIQNNGNIEVIDNVFESLETTLTEQEQQTFTKLLEEVSTYIEVTGADLTDLSGIYESLKVSEKESQVRLVARDLKTEYIKAQKGKIIKTLVIEFGLNAIPGVNIFSSTGSFIYNLNAVNNYYQNRVVEDTFNPTSKLGQTIKTRIENKLRKNLTIKNVQKNITKGTKGIEIADINNVLQTYLSEVQASNNPKIIEVVIEKIDGDLTQSQKDSYIKALQQVEAYMRINSVDASTAASLYESFTLKEKDSKINSIKDAIKIKDKGDLIRKATASYLIMSDPITGSFLTTMYNKTAKAINSGTFNPKSTFGKIYKTTVEKIMNIGKSTQVSTSEESVKSVETSEIKTGDVHFDIPVERAKQMIDMQDFITKYIRPNLGGTSYSQYVRFNTEYFDPKPTRAFLEQRYKGRPNVELDYWTNGVGRNLTNETGAFFNVSIGKEGNTPYRNSYKIYLPVTPSTFAQTATSVFDYLIDNNIASDNKISKTSRADSIVLRIYNINDAMKVLNFIDANTVIPSNAQGIPFAMRMGKASIAMDGGLSYNSVSTNLFDRYMQIAINPSVTGFTEWIDLILDTVYKKGDLSILDNIFGENTFFGIPSEYNNHLQVIKLLRISLDPNSTINDYFEMCSKNQDYNEVSMQEAIVESILSSEYVPMEDVTVYIPTKVVERLNNVFDILKNKYGVREALERLNEYVSSKDPLYITSTGNARNIITSTDMQYVAEYVKGQEQNYKNGKIVEETKEAIKVNETIEETQIKKETDVIIEDVSTNLEKNTSELSEQDLEKVIAGATQEFGKEKFEKLNKDQEQVIPEKVETQQEQVIPEMIEIDKNAGISIPKAVYDKYMAESKTDFKLTLSAIVNLNVFENNLLNGIFVDSYYNIVFNEDIMNAFDNIDNYRIIKSTLEKINKNEIISDNFNLFGIDSKTKAFVYNAHQVIYENANPIYLPVTIEVGSEQFSTIGIMNVLKNVENSLDEVVLYDSYQTSEGITLKSVQQFINEYIENNDFLSNEFANEIEIFNQKLMFKDMYMTIAGNVYSLLPVEITSKQSLESLIDNFEAFTNTYNLDNAIMKEATEILEMLKGIDVTEQNLSAVTEYVYNKISDIHVENNMSSQYREFNNLYKENGSIGKTIEAMEIKGKSKEVICSCLLQHSSLSTNLKVAEEFYYKAFDYLVEKGMTEKTAAIFVNNEAHRILDLRGTRIVKTTANGINIRIVNNAVGKNLKVTLEQVEQMLEQTQKIFAKTGLKNFVIYDVFSPSNIYFEKVKYKDYVERNGGKRFISAAAANDVRIRVWSSFNYLPSIVHEYGHTIDLQLQKDLGLKTRFAESPIWLEAVESDKKLSDEIISNYSTANSVEDFAEFVQYTYLDPVGMALKFPNRFNATSQYLNFDIAGQKIYGADNVYNLLEQISKATGSNNVLSILNDYLNGTITDSVHSNIINKIFNVWDSYYSNKIDILKDIPIYDILEQIKYNEGLSTGEYLQVLKSYIDGKDISGSLTTTNNVELISKIDMDTIKDYYQEEINSSTAETKVKEIQETEKQSGELTKDESFTKKSHEDVSQEMIALDKNAGISIPKVIFDKYMVESKIDFSLTLSAIIDLKVFENNLSNGMFVDKYYNIVFKEDIMSAFSNIDNYKIIKSTLEKINRNEIISNNSDMFSSGTETKAFVYNAHQVIYENANPIYVPNSVVLETGEYLTRDILDILENKDNSLEELMSNKSYQGISIETVQQFVENYVSSNQELSKVLASQIDEFNRNISSIHNQELNVEDSELTKKIKGEFSDKIAILDRNIKDVKDAISLNEIEDLHYLYDRVLSLVQEFDLGNSIPTPLAEIVYGLQEKMLSIEVNVNSSIRYAETISNLMGETNSRLYKVVDLLETMRNRINHAAGYIDTSRAYEISDQFNYISRIIGEDIDDIKAFVKKGNYLACEDMLYRVSSNLRQLEEIADDARTNSLIEYVSESFFDIDSELNQVTTSIKEITHNYKALELNSEELLSIEGNIKILQEELLDSISDTSNVEMSYDASVAESFENAQMDEIRLYKQNNDGNLREKIIKDNMDLVSTIAHSYASFSNIDQYELESYGHEGLILALENFDVNYGGSFTAYATSYIRGHILGGIQEIMHGKRDNFYYDYIDAKNVIEKDNGMTLKDNPNLADDIVNLLVERGKIKDNVASRESARRRIRALVIDNVNIHDIALIEKLNRNGELIDSHNYEEMVLNEMSRGLLEEVLDTLPSDESKVLRLRYGFDGEALTINEVAKLMKITPDRVRGFEERALRHMRHPSRSKVLRDLLSGDTYNYQIRPNARKSGTKVGTGKVLYDFKNIMKDNTTSTKQKVEQILKIAHNKTSYADSIAYRDKLYKAITEPTSYYDGNLVSRNKAGEMINKAYESIIKERGLETIGEVSGITIRKVGGFEVDSKIIEFVERHIPKMLEMYKGKVGLSEIVLYDTFNPYDCIFAAESGKSSFESQASVTYADGRISLWKSFMDNALADTLYHEQAHLIQREMSKANPEFDSEYIEAVKKDGGYITDYAKTSLSEDFAETLGIYTDGNQIEVASKFINRYAVISKYNENMRLNVEDALKVVYDVLERNGINFSNAIYEYFETGKVSEHTAITEVLSQYSIESITKSLVKKDGIYSLNENAHIPNTIKVIESQDKFNSTFDNNEVSAKEAETDMEIIDVSEIDTLQKEINLVINEDSVIIDGETISIDFIKKQLEHTYSFKALLKKNTYERSYDSIEIQVDKIIKTIKILEEKGIIEITDAEVKRAVDLYSEVGLGEMIFNIYDIMDNSHNSGLIILPKRVVEKYGESFINEIINSQALDRVPNVEISKLQEFAKEEVISKRYSIFKNQLVEFENGLPKKIQYTDVNSLLKYLQKGDVDSYYFYKMLDLIKYIKENNVNIEFSEAAKPFVEMFSNIPDNHLVLNIDDVIAGKGPITFSNKIEVNGKTIDTQKIIDILKSPKKIYDVMKNEYGDINKNNIKDAIDAFIGDSQVIKGLYKYAEVLELIEKCENSCILKVDYETYYLIPKTYKGYDSHDLIDMLEYGKKIIIKPNINKYINNSLAERLKLIETLNEFIEYVNALDSKINYTFDAEVLELLQRKVEIKTEAVRTPLQSLFEEVRSNKGTYGTNQGVVRKLIKNLGVNNVIESIFGDTISESKFLETFETLDIKSEELQSKLLDKIFDGELLDTGTTSEFRLLYEKKVFDSLVEQVTANYPGISAKDAIRFLYLLESNEAGGRGICNYASAANMIFERYIGKEIQFEMDFGYPMYIETANGRVLNDARLLVDMYSTINKDVLIKMVNGKYVVLNESSNYINLAASWTSINEFLMEKQIPYRFEQTFSITSSSSNIKYEEIIETIKEKLLKGESVMFSAAGFDVINHQDTVKAKEKDVARGEIIVKDCGGHIMTVVGINEKGNLIVDSWGIECEIDLLKELQRSGEKVKTESEGNSKNRYVSLNCYSIVDTSKVENNPDSGSSSGTQVSQPAFAESNFDDLEIIDVSETFVTEKKSFNLEDKISDFINKTRYNRLIQEINKDNYDSKVFDKMNFGLTSQTYIRQMIMHSVETISTNPTLFFKVCSNFDVSLITSVIEILNSEFENVVLEKLTSINISIYDNILTQLSEDKIVLALTKYKGNFDSYRSYRFIEKLSVEARKKVLLEYMDILDAFKIDNILRTFNSDMIVDFIVECVSKNDSKIIEKLGKTDASRYIASNSKLSLIDKTKLLLLFSPRSIEQILVDDNLINELFKTNDIIIVSKFFENRIDAKEIFKKHIAANLEISIIDKIKINELFKLELTELIPIDTDTINELYTKGGIEFVQKLLKGRFDNGEIFKNYIADNLEISMIDKIKLIELTYFYTGLNMYDLIPIDTNVINELYENGGIDSILKLLKHRTEVSEIIRVHIFKNSFISSIDKNKFYDSLAPHVKLYLKYDLLDTDIINELYANGEIEFIQHLIRHRTDRVEIFKDYISNNPTISLINKIKIAESCSNITILMDLIPIDTNVINELYENGGIDSILKLLKHRTDVVKIFEKYISSNDTVSLINKIKIAESCGNITILMDLIPIDTNVINELLVECDLDFIKRFIEYRSEGLEIIKKSLDNNIKAKTAIEYYKTLAEDYGQSFNNYLFESQNGTFRYEIYDNLAIENIGKMFIKISQSNSIELRNQGIRYIDSILKQKDPLDAYDKIEKIFLKNNLPFVGKAMNVFSLLHMNNGVVMRHYSISPYLKSKWSIGDDVKVNKEMQKVIFRDFVRIALRSNNKSMRDYIENIKVGNDIFESLQSEQDIEKLSVEQKEILEIFVSHLDMLYYSLKGKTLYDGDKYTLYKNIKRIKRVFTRNYKVNLPDSIVSIFCHDAGFDTIESIEKYMREEVEKADIRNREYAHQLLEGREIEVDKYDVLHNISNYNFLEGMLQNGIVSGELIPEDGSTDFTPLGSDWFMRVADGKESFTSALKTANYAMRSITIGIANEEHNFLITRNKEVTTNILLGYAEKIDKSTFDVNKLEFYHTGVCDLTDYHHYDLRTGASFADVRFIAVPQSFVSQVAFETAKNGYYIPIVDRETGKLAFTPEQFDKLRAKMSGMAYYDMNEYNASQLVESTSEVITRELFEYLKTSSSPLFEVDIVRELIGDKQIGQIEEITAQIKEDFRLIEEGNLEKLSIDTISMLYEKLKNHEFDSIIRSKIITGDSLSTLLRISELDVVRKRNAINQTISEVLSEFGLKLKTQIDGDISSGAAEIIDTGSTGRYANVPGDGDFDFTIRMDADKFNDQAFMDKFSKALQEKFKSLESTKAEGEVPIIAVSIGNDIRFENVKINGLDVLVDIDISFVQRTNKVEYSTDMALGERYSNMSTYERDLIVANVIRMKQLMKQNECYKPARKDANQGGLGGVGYENLVLQNGGSTLAAAIEFIEATRTITFDEYSKEHIGATFIEYMESTKNNIKSFDEFYESYSLWDFGKNHFAEKKKTYPHDNFVGNMLDNNNAFGYPKVIKAFEEYIIAMDNVKVENNPDSGSSSGTQVSQQIQSSNDIESIFDSETSQTIDTIKTLDSMSDDFTITVSDSSLTISKDIFDKYGMETVKALESILNDNNKLIEMFESNNTKMIELLTEVLETSTISRSDSNVELYQSIELILKEIENGNRVINVRDVILNNSLPNSLSNSDYKLSLVKDLFENARNAEMPTFNDLIDFFESDYLLPNTLSELIEESSIVEGYNKVEFINALELLVKISKEQGLQEIETINEIEFILKNLSDKNTSVDSMYDIISNTHMYYKARRLDGYSDFVQLYDTTKSARKTLEMLESQRFNIEEIAEILLTYSIVDVSNLEKSRGFYYFTYNYLVEKGMNEVDAANYVKEKMEEILVSRGNRVIATTPSGINIRMVNGANTKNIHLNLEQINQMLQVAENMYPNTALKAIYIYDTFDYDTIYFEKVSHKDYLDKNNMKRFISAASATDIAINIWTDFNDLNTIIHEYGHTIDHALQTKLELYKPFSETKQWIDAIKLDKTITSELISTYSTSSNMEDFAEFLQHFYQNPIDIALKYPNRYKVVSRYINLKFDESALSKYVEKYNIFGLFQQMSKFINDKNSMEMLISYVSNNSVKSKQYGFVNQIFKLLDKKYSNRLDIIFDIGVYSLMYQMKLDLSLTNDEIINILKDYIDGKDISGYFEDKKFAELISKIDIETIREYYYEELD